MNLTYKFQLKPSKKQISDFKKILGVHSELYNEALFLKDTQYKETGKSDSCFTQIKSLVPKFNGRANYSSLQQTVRRLHKNYTLLYQRQGGRPKPKELKSVSYSRHGDGWKIKGDSLYLQGVGDVPINLHREIAGKISSCVVKLSNGRLFISVSTEREPEIREGEAKAIGIDYGLKTFLTTSDGDKIEHPRPLFQSRKRLAKINRQIFSKSIARETKEKKKKARRKIYEKIANQRKDFAHKLSRKLVNENSYIAIENLEVKKMKPKGKGSRLQRNTNRKASDLAIAQFYDFLSYKAESAGRQLVRVDPAYTSRRCFSCGREKILSLEDRVYSCSCGYEIDRDINAAKNILKRALEKVKAVGLYSLAQA